ncbi:MAG: RagB/SusD family nutrient uptake outer membrane protein [Bacteroidales bacterium]|nr:RagB/SusD family nutrient uptake outer membrane protein [Bacteroidales bacterium]
MKNIFKSFLLVAAAATIASCDLNLAPNNAISYQDGGQIFVTAGDVTSFRTGIYGYYRSLTTGASDRSDYNWIISTEVMCDGFNAHIDYGNRFGLVHRANEKFTESDYSPEYMWAYYYFGIKDYNIVIAGSDNCAAGLEDAVRQIKGEACFFRASAYLDLARVFGKAYDPATAATDLCVPLILKYNPNDKPARATVKEVYDAIKADLDTAAVCLAGVAGKAKGSEVTIDVVNALYARYYLDTKDYAKAAEKASALIEGGLYPLTTTADDLFDAYVMDSGDESIIMLYASKTEHSNSMDEYAGYAASDKTPEGFAYSQPDYIPTKKLINAYDADDFRLEKWYGGDTIAVKVGGDFVKGKFKVLTKFVGNPDLESKGYPMGHNASKPLKISEQYLIAAEAYMMNGGDKTNAAKYLNALQVARNASTTDATIGNIQNEWFRETVGEGLRISCLKRWGLGFSAREPQDGAAEAKALIEGPDFMDKTAEAGDFQFCWPIPGYERKINENLVQNPGYTETE